MLINNVKLFDGSIVNIGIAGDKVSSVTESKDHNESLQLKFENAIAFPGLINSHDHLDFNLFPQLGNNIYNNYTEWGNYIHKKYQNEISKVLRIPETLRTSWGIYKNLLCGVTTVVNHGKKLEVLNPLITVLQEAQSVHSPGFEKFWKLKLNDPLKKHIPCVIHAGEGTDEKVKQEIDELIKYNLFKRPLIAVHGVAMNEDQAQKFKALVWCPESNYFLLNKTADVHHLKEKIKICFGTDSTLTADWNVWKHIQAAQKSGLATEAELFQMLTSTPADVWKLNKGFIAEGKDADIVVARAKPNFFKSFSTINPQDILLVIHNGDICLFDEELIPQLKTYGFNFMHYFKTGVNGTTKYVQGNLPKLVSLIKSYYPEAALPVSVSLEELKYAS